MQSKKTNSGHLQKKWMSQTREGSGRYDRERWQDPFGSFSIEAAQLGLQRHTSEKGKHAEALEIREDGEEGIE